MVGNPIEKVTIDKPDGFIHLLFVPYETAKEAHMAWHGMAWHGMSSLAGCSLVAQRHAISTVTSVSLLPFWRSSIP
jgi:hypothetical protein